MRFLALLAFVLAFAALVLIVRDAVASPPPPTGAGEAIVEGRDVHRWRELALQRDRTARAQARTIRRLRREVAEPLSTPRIVCLVFRDACAAALRVAWCESRWDVGAVNGQYLGLFQMGRWARSKYGHGRDALTQALAAHAYYLDEGWQGWECRP